MMDFAYDWTHDSGGNVAMLAQLSTVTAGESVTHDIAIGFGSTHDAAMAQAGGSLAGGYDAP